MVDKSVTDMWTAYLHTLGDSANKDIEYTAWPFGGNAKQARELADLVKSGKKTATSSLYLFYELDNESPPQIGEYSVITDWSGEAEVIIHNTDVSIIRFHEVDAVFARKEGEGDRSLDYWRRVHIDFFANELKQINRSFDENMWLVCEEFRVVYQ